MRPEDEVRIRHLLDAGSKALEYSSGKTRDDLSEDEVLRLALTKLVEIVGEAAKQVSTETSSEYPTVPWSAAARMRDRLVDHYFDIDLDVLWATITDDLPALLSALPPLPELEL